MASGEMQEKGDRLSFLDGFRGAAILMVVATHVLDYTQMPGDMKAAIAFWVQAIAVPPFFLADGFLFLRKLDRSPEWGYGQYIRLSARRLLVPWIVFSLLYAVLRLGFELVDHSAQPVIRGRGIAEIMAAIYYSAVSAQLYFLPALFLVRCGAVLTRRLATYPAMVLLGMWVAYAGAWQALDVTRFFDHGLDPVLNASWGMQYYLLGMALYRYQNLVNAYAIPLTIATGIVFAFVKWVVPAGPVFQQYGYLLFALFAFISLQDDALFFPTLGRYTMEIYLLHAPVPVKAASLIVGRAVESSTFAYYVTVVCFTFGAAYLAAIVLGRTRPGSVIIGNAT